MSVEVPMKTENSHHCAKSYERHKLFLLVFFMIVLLTGTTLAAGSGDTPRKHENGKLSGVEKNNSVTTVIISEKGYTVDSSVLVVNAAGLPISLDKLTLPTDVNFEYSYMKSGPKSMSPVIVYIEETKKNSNNGRSKQ
jgi:hypothetical protein